MNRATIEWDGECIRATLACIHDNVRSFTGRSLEVEEEWRQEETKETRQLTSIDHDSLHLEANRENSSVLAGEG